MTSPTIRSYPPKILGSDWNNVISVLSDSGLIDGNARLGVKKNSAASVTGTRRTLNLIEGSNVTLTVADDSVDEEVDVTIAAAAAPTDATYVTLSTNSTLSGERVLTGTSNQITITDNGAGSTVVLSTPQNIHTAASPTFAGLTLSGLTAGSIVFAGTSGVISQDNANLFWNDSTNRLGIGASPNTVPLEIEGTGDFMLFLRDDSNVAHGMTSQVPTSVYFALGKGSGGSGGAFIRGFSDAGTNTGFFFDGVIGSNDPTDTVPALQFRGFKKDSGTSVTTLGAAETVAQFLNGGSTVLMSILGGGTVGIGSDAPDSNTILQVRKDQNGSTSIKMTNQTSGTLALTRLLFGDHAANTDLFFTAYNTSFSGNGLLGFAGAATGEFATNSNAVAMVVGTRGAYPFVISTSATPRARVLSTGDLLVGGTTVPSNISANTGRIYAENSSGNALIAVVDDTAVAANTGPAGFYMIGRVNDTGPVDSTLGRISAFKENATQGNTASYMQLYTDGGSGLAVRLKIDSAGHAGLGTTTLTGRLNVDNEAVAVSIARFLDNGTLKLSIFDGGGVELGSGTTTPGPSRIAFKGGTAEATTDWAASAGWGASATVSAVSGNDSRGTVTVTTNAADTPTANPTVTLTFKDGTWTTAPFAVSCMVSSSTGPINVPVTITTTATTLVIQYNGTPTATSALTYIFAYQVIG